MQSTRKSYDLKGVIQHLVIIPIFITFLGILLFLVIPDPTSAQTIGLISPISIDNANAFGVESSSHPSISSDGRFIAFISSAGNLISNNLSANKGILIHDRLNGDTFQVPLSRSGVEQNLFPLSIEISGDGRFIAIAAHTWKNSSMLDDPLKPNAVFLHDNLTGETYQVLFHPTVIDPKASPLLPTLSGDGRFTVFPSLERNPADPENNRNAFTIYDRVTEHNYIIAIPGTSQQEDTGSMRAKISDDGRTIIYQSGLYPEILGHYNRVTTENSLLDLSTQSGSFKLIDFDLTANGNTLAFISQISDSSTNGDDNFGIFLYDNNEGETSLVRHLVINQPDQLSMALSGEGDHLVLHYSSGDQGGVLFRVDLDTGSEILIDKGLIGPTIDLSLDGSSVVYTKEVGGISQVFLWDERREVNPTYVLAGQVTDSSGHPLALVTIQDDRGDVIRTDADGYFWLEGIGPGGIVIRASKEGFRFEPDQILLEVESDIKDLHIVYAHDEALQEAQKDLGMPYSFNRGQSGPFHRYSAGYCTDLVLDAYTWGVDFNIQFALEQDFRANPWHFYRWRDARNAHDMWRYFSYSGQLQPHENPYQPGDIVFFDWAEDGEIDHVAVISEINSRNRPRMMYAATGVIASNPGGLAAELPWKDFHEQTVRGFARWSGKYEPIIQNLPPGQVLQIALGGSGGGIRLIDPGGDVISNSQVGIPGGRYDDWIWEQVISLNQQFSDGTFFLVVLSNPKDNPFPFQFTAQFIENGFVNGRVETNGILNPKEIKRIPLLLNMGAGGMLTIEPGNSNRRIEGVLNR
jgi:hypothetical protein